jgi:hypothetical protein
MKVRPAYCFLQPLSQLAAQAAWRKQDRLGRDRQAAGRVDPCVRGRHLLDIWCHVAARLCRPSWRSSFLQRCSIRPVCLVSCCLLPLGSGLSQAHMVGPCPCKASPNHVAVLHCFGGRAQPRGSSCTVRCLCLDSRAGATSLALPQLVSTPERMKARTRSKLSTQPAITAISYHRCTCHRHRFAASFNASFTLWCCCQASPICSSASCTCWLSSPALSCQWFKALSVCLAGRGR